MLCVAAVPFKELSVTAAESLTSPTTPLCGSNSKFSEQSAPGVNENELLHVIETSAKFCVETGPTVPVSAWLPIF
jgi:hypothetical protein